MTVSFITGASTGIGYATALRLARDGHDVVATMRTPSASDLAQVAAGEGLSLEVRALDVTDDSAVDRAIGDVIAESGGIDVLVNNAGVTGGGTVEDAPYETYERAMETNFFGALRCTKAVLPSMRERGSGCIVSVTSQGGRIAVPTLSAYSASKFALEALMEVLAAEVASFGIRVAIIEPGAILTPMVGKNADPVMDGPYGPTYQKFLTLAMHDFGQGSTPDVVADCIAEAITCEPPRLRWPVGQGAERNIARRASMSDEATIAMWNDPDHDSFLKTMLGDET
jgi:NAD(P)-dependent dehydrogenase (short-subunit alcohol dehydrogenase family)